MRSDERALLIRRHFHAKFVQKSNLISQQCFVKTSNSVHLNAIQPIRAPAGAGTIALGMHTPNRDRTNKVRAATK